MLNQIEQQWLNSIPHYKSSYEFFVQWRKNNVSSPTHLVVYEYLIKYDFDWADLRDKSIELQPHFQNNEFNKLYDMDMAIIGIAMSQLTTENKIQQYLLEMAENAISRQLSEKVKNKVTSIRFVKWNESLLKIYNIFETQTNIELPNSNIEYFRKYFNDKKEE